MRDLLLSPAAMAAYAVIIAAIIAGFWGHLPGHYKNKIDAQTAMLEGYMRLLKLYEDERNDLILRMGVLEDENQSLERRVAKLERALIQNGIDLPNGEGDEHD